MFQYKLIHVLDDESINKIKAKFEENEIHFFTDNIIGIKYSVKRNTYTEVLRKLVDMNVRQYTFTSYIFKKLIHVAFESNLFLEPIEFVDHLDEEINFEYMNNYIFEINNSKNINKKEYISNTFFKELNWVMLEDSIDIKNIKIKISLDVYPFESEVVFYNNGVIFIDSKESLPTVNEIFTKII